MKQPRPISVRGRNPWKVVNPAGVRWADSFQTQAKAWARVIAAHGMQDHPRTATKELIAKGWRVERN